MGYNKSQEEGNQKLTTAFKNKKNFHGSSETIGLLEDIKETMDSKKEAMLGGVKAQHYGRSADLLQVFLCIIANTPQLSSGLMLGFTSIALPFMEQPNDVLNVTKDEASWITSIASISTPVGCLVSGPILDAMGRKFSLLLINVPAVVGWLLIGIKPTLLQLYIGRALTGLATGLSSIPATVYMAESSTPSLRGYLVTGTSIAISLGVAIVYTMGLFLKENWQLAALLCALFPVFAAILTVIFIPESPVWLLNREKPERAKKSLMRLRATKDPGLVQNELDAMEEQAQRSKHKPSFANVMRALVKPTGYKPLLVMNGFFLFQQLTGTFVVIMYAVNVVQEAGVTTDPFIVAVLIGLTRLVFTIVAAWMSRRFGRRMTAIISGIGMAFSLMVLATHLLLQHQHILAAVQLQGNGSTDVDKTVTTGATVTSDRPPNFLPVIMLLIYIMSGTIGFLTLPWAMIGELFPSQIRGVASGFTTSMTYLVSAVAVKLYPTMVDEMGKHGVFYFYGVNAIYGTVFVFFFLPETEGKTLDEIENHFAGRRKRKIVMTDEEEALNSTKMVTIVKSQKA